MGDEKGRAHGGQKGVVWLSQKGGQWCQGEHVVAEIAVALGGKTGGDGDRDEWQAQHRQVVQPPEKITQDHGGEHRQDGSEENQHQQVAVQMVGRTQGESDQEAVVDVQAGGAVRKTEQAGDGVADQRRQQPGQGGVGETEGGQNEQQADGGMTGKQDGPVGAQQFGEGLRQAPPEPVKRALPVGARAIGRRGFGRSGHLPPLPVCSNRLPPWERATAGGPAGVPGR